MGQLHVLMAMDNMSKQRQCIRGLGASCLRPYCCQLVTGCRVRAEDYLWSSCSTVPGASMVCLAFRHSSSCFLQVEITVGMG